MEVRAWVQSGLRVRRSWVAVIKRYRALLVEKRRYNTRNEATYVICACNAKREDCKYALRFHKKYSLSLPLSVYAVDLVYGDASERSTAY